MKKKLTILLIFILNFSLWSQNLDKKKQQLEDLKSKISKQEELIKKSEKDIKNTSKNLKSKEKKKKQAEKKIKKLKQTENKAQDDLNKTVENLNISNKRLQIFDQLRQDELRKLCIAHYEKMIFPQKEIDSRLLASLILNTNTEIQLEKGTKGDLEKKKKTEDKDLENIKWSKYVTNKNKKKITKSINNLSSNLSSYKSKKKKAIKNKELYEKEASALHELIAKLQTNIADDEYSYKFSTEKLIWPVKGDIINKFGLQKSGAYNVSTLNNGIDIRAVEGTEVVAVDKGVVAFAEWFTGAGKMVIIDHQNGFFTLYSHNSNILVAKGDNITKNQKIALTGKTGSTEEACLHFEIRKRGNPVDPLHYLE
ncbi:MAG: M23 family metallopeptidase [Candidatus Cloacimonetes bacterium]|nr:M23 family metallopeptidase [Candidatus Cloacimonadota bacterium]